MDLESQQVAHHVPQDFSTASTKPPNLSRDEKRHNGWKYQGYPEFTKFVASSDDLCVIRRFSQFGARVLLRMQDGISVLESRIEELDHESMNGTADVDGIDSFRIDRENHVERDN